MSLSGQFQVCSFSFLFLRKNCERTKTQIKPKPTKKNKNKQTKNNKVKNFLHTETSKMVKVVYFAFWWFFYAQNFYGKKKSNRLETALITSLTILVTCTPINPSIESFFCTHLFLIV